MKTSLLIIGAGSHGRVAAEIGHLLGYKKVAFLDVGFHENPVSKIWNVLGLPEDLLKFSPDEYDFFVGAGDTIARKMHVEYIESKGYSLINLIHPSAVVSSHAKLDSNVLIGANAVVNGFSLLGKGVVINTGACVDHDCEIGSFSHVAPKACLCGFVKIGNESWVGAGSVVKEKINVGTSVMIGAGSVVVKNVLDHVTVMGNPARVSKI